MVEADDAPVEKTIPEAPLPCSTFASSCHRHQLHFSLRQTTTFFFLAVAITLGPGMNLATGGHEAPPSVRVEAARKPTTPGGGWRFVRAKR